MGNKDGMGWDRDGRGYIPKQQQLSVDGRLTLFPTEEEGMVWVSWPDGMDLLYSVYVCMLA